MCFEVESSNNWLLDQPYSLISVTFISLSINSVQYSQPIPVCYVTLRGHGFSSDSYSNQGLYVCYFKNCFML